MTSAQPKDVHEEAERLSKIPMFSKLEPSKLKLLAFTSDAVEFADGQIMFRADEPSDCMYVVLEGEVQIMTELEDGQLVPVFTVGANSLIGELAVLRNQPRSATVRAAGQVSSLRISNDMFIKLLTENPVVALDVMRQLSDKVAVTHQEVTELQRRIRHYEQEKSAATE